MAEAEAATQAGKGGFDFLKQKAGPLPIGVWLVAAVGIWWWLQKKQKTAGTTDPAGNVGTINPATGYVAGSPQDQAALAGQNASSNSGSGGATVAGSYPDNAAWGRAAINYLVGLGIDPTAANEAIQSYLSSQPLNANQQADVNLAIQGIGAPPQPPGPVGVAPSPIAGGGSGLPGAGGAGGSGGGSGGGVQPGGTKNPPSGGSGNAVKHPNATNPVTGLVVTGKHRTSLAVKWNSSRNATGYHVKCTEAGNNKVAGEFDTTSPSATFGNLTGGKMYVVDVWATPHPGSAPHAHVSATLPRTG